jgi:hypothetical protein
MVDHWPVAWPVAVTALRCRPTTLPGHRLAFSSTARCRDRRSIRSSSAAAALLRARHRSTLPALPRSTTSARRNRRSEGRKLRDADKGLLRPTDPSLNVNAYCDCGWHYNLMPLPRRRRRDALLDGRGHHRRCEGPAAGIDTRGDQLLRARDLPGRPPEELPLRPAVRGRDRCELRPSERHYDEHLPHRALAQAAP